MTTEEINQKIADLEAEMQGVSFWQNKGRAQEVIRGLGRLKTVKDTECSLV